jgi:hypothetical protein
MALMSRSIACLLAAVSCTAGCQNPTPNLAATDRIGVETTSPALVDGVNQVDAITTVTQDYSPDQLGSLPIGGDCTVQTTDPARSVHGTIAEVTPAGVVLTDAEETIEARSTTGVPMMNKIPATSRLFRNTGVGRDVRAVGTVTIPAGEIASVRASQIVRQ